MSLLATVFGDSESFLNILIWIIGPLISSGMFILIKANVTVSELLSEKTVAKIIK